MRVLITGGDGYIGSNLVYLLQDRHQIVLYGHGSHYTELREMGRKFYGIIGNMDNHAWLTKSMEGVDAVVHLAATTDATVAYQNVGNTAMVLSAARISNVKKFIFASSYVVYGPMSDRNITENTSPHPVSMYAFSKLACEDDIVRSGLDFTIMRISHVYGEGHGVRQQGGLISTFIKSAVQNGVIEMTSPSEVRDYVNVIDVGLAFMKALEVGAPKEIINVASGVSITVGDMADIIAKTVHREKGIPVRLVSSSSTLKNYPVPVVNIDKAREKLGYSPVYDLEANIVNQVKGETE